LDSGFWKGNIINTPGTVQSFVQTWRVKKRLDDFCIDWYRANRHCFY